ncbi:RNA polymerase sigma-70 factor [Leifsonia shinshuensis]|uniref:RNA polymerase sigma-70 factor n=1 Tax=Leifsonia shinshuensis TaxID=150026 RepID=A0A7G6YD49_9MICO|nr:RNA polymerase sigma-70 factor [Leifsonia shinshuensis]QNE36414.1 RNA polymerase sigma-70 factor [Leifsonia shinshuensis]
MPQPDASDRPSGDDDLASAVATFAEVRPRLFGIAYRMLGTVADAEDIVQDTWLRWQAYDRSTVREPAAFLATATTRLAMNAATSAHATRETYIGPWLPEPVDTSQDPTLGAERGEALGFAVLVLLEKLSAAERAAYVLREAFDYPYAEIARIVETSEPAARQLVSRARKHLAAERASRVVADEERTRLLTAFMTAAEQGDMAALEKLFADDVVSLSDGGGVVRATRIPVVGAVTVAKYIHAFASRFWEGSALHLAELNGEPAIVATRDGDVFAYVTADFDGAGIHRLYWVLNPYKLGHVSAA